MLHGEPLEERFKVQGLYFIGLNTYWNDGENHREVKGNRENRGGGVVFDRYFFNGL